MIPLSFLLRIFLIFHFLLAQARLNSHFVTPDTPARSGEWMSLSDGISFKNSESRYQPGNVLITFGGFLQPESSVKGWNDALYNQKGHQLNIKHQIAVKGPMNDYYQNRELNLKRFITYLDSLFSDPGFHKSEAVVICYSSGVFVFHEMLNLISAGSSDLQKRFTDRFIYFSLDGAMGKTQGIFLKEQSTGYIKNIYGVYAENGTDGTKSARFNDVMDLVNYYKAKSSLVVVNSSVSGCNKGAKWCVHESLIVKYPPYKAGLSWAYDYDFGKNGEYVTSEYLNNIIRAGEK